MKDINVMCFFIAFYDLFIIFLLFAYKVFGLANNIDSYFIDGFNYKINDKIRTNLMPNLAITYRPIDHYSGYYFVTYPLVFEIRAKLRQ